MLRIIFLIFLFLTITMSVYCLIKKRNRIISKISCITNFVTLILLLIISYICFDSKLYYDAKAEIEERQSENYQIEQNIKELVEANIKLKNGNNEQIILSKDYINICYSIPELSSNELVQKQLERYAYNKYKISEKSKILDENIDYNKIKFYEWIMYGK